MESDATEAAENYLQEKLFGTKEAVSTTILSFQIGQTLTDASRTLQSFFESHRDVLDASYKVKTCEQSITTIKIVAAKDLSESLSRNAQIWIVSAQSAADKAVIASVSATAQKLQNDLSIGRLKHLGFVTNPLLEDNFTVSDAASSARRKPPADTVDTVGRPVTSGVRPKEEMPEDTTAVKAAPASNVSINRKTSETPKPAAPKQKAASEQVKKPKTNTGFFNKTSKGDALKSMHSKSARSKPVHEAVVISDEIQDHASEDTETGALSKSSKEEQMQQLRESMFREEGSGDEEMADYQSDEDLGDHVEDSPTDHAMDVDGIPGPQPGVDLGLKDLSESVGGMSKSGSQADPPASKGTDTHKHRKTRRVRRNVIRKDDEGFDIHEEVWVDVPIESDGEPSEGPENSGVAGAMKPEPQDGPEPTNNKEAHVKIESEVESERKKVAKAPPKMPSGKKKQKTLMSFFSKP